MVSLGVDVEMNNKYLSKQTVWFFTVVPDTQKLMCLFLLWIPSQLYEEREFVEKETPILLLLSAQPPPEFRTCFAIELISITKSLHYFFQISTHGLSRSLSLFVCVSLSLSFETYVRKGAREEKAFSVKDFCQSVENQKFKKTFEDPLEKRKTKNEKRIKVERNGTFYW